MTEPSTPPLLSNRPNKVPDPSWIGVIVGAVLCCAALSIELRFRSDVMALSSETSLRPMGMAVAETGLFLLGLLLGVPFSLLGMSLARSERKRLRFWLGLMGMILSLLPVPITRIVLNETLHQSGIHLSP